ncbi:MAG: C45 family autoproteolytic acyltransferase/hydrolase [Negativicutes bacterium]|nr:C45 family autoproteolytic acyltransferase/hydrolase [Negativicutes bacterium]
MGKKLSTLLCCVLFLCLSSRTEACTAWEAAGSSVEGNGTIIAKNRDYTYGEKNELKVVSVHNRYKFLAIYANTGNKGGVNEHGLVVLSLSPPSYLENQKTEPSNSQPSFTNTWILENCRTVDETVDALKQHNWNTHPEFLAIADRNKIAYIELGPDGRNVVKATENGILDHTNHYLDPAMGEYNPKKLGYEYKRWQKAEEQLNSKDKFTIEDIKTFTQDPIVWYKHSTVMTYASMVVNNRQDGETVVWVKIVNPGDAAFESQFTLKDMFTGRIPLHN